MFRPRVETLEDRAVPAVTIGLDPGDPGILLITGDNLANEIQICQDDDLDYIHIKSLNGQFVAMTYNSAPIHTIRVNLGDRNDKLIYSLEKDLDFAKTLQIDPGAGHDEIVIWTADGTIYQDFNVFIGQRNGPNDGNERVTINLGNVSDANVHVDAHLGNGDDSFAVSFHGPGKSDAAISGISIIHIDAHGGAGRDGLYFFGERRFKTDIGTLITGLDVSPWSQLRVDYNGEGDDDLISVFYRGVLFGFFEVDAHGSTGNDRVEATIVVKDGVRPATGEMDIDLYGDAGDDFLGMSLDLAPGVVFTGFQNPFIDGGADFDTIAFLTALVGVNNMEA